MPTTAQKDNAILTVRQAVSNIINGAAQFRSIAAEDQATGIISNLTDEDLTGNNQGLTADQLRGGFQALAKILTDVQDSQKNPELAKLIFSIKL